MLARSLLVLCITCLAACSRPLPQPKSGQVKSAGLTGKASASEYSGAVESARKKARAFDYRKTDALSIRRQKISSVANLVTEKFTVEINDPLRKIGTFEQKYLFYHCPGNEPRPTVVLLTLFGDEILLDRLTARSFCRKGFNVLIVIPTQVHGETDRPFDQVNDVFTRNIITARMGIDLLEQLPETDPERLFTYGTSMGGIRGAMLFGAEPRLKRAGVITGGGDIPGIVAASKYGTLQGIREARMAAENIPDITSLRAYLENILTVDPLDFACLREPEDIAFVISTNDDYVGTDFQEQLYDAFSRPRDGRYPGAIYVKTDHILTGIRIREWTSSFAKFFHAY
ncbi:MAG: pimeloyl-ACP methyl ester carboxylesterase [Verrucomicrobiales bacterium]|jgi:pimeloyl-ACP methyl ester carboxylesterase